MAWCDKSQGDYGVTDFYAVARSAPVSVTSVDRIVWKRFCNHWSLAAGLFNEVIMQALFVDHGSLETIKSMSRETKTLALFSSYLQTKAYQERNRRGSGHESYKT